MQLMSSFCLVNCLSLAIRYRHDPQISLFTDHPVLNRDSIFVFAMISLFYRENDALISECIPKHHLGYEKA
jgi:hypothetical protein